MMTYISLFSGIGGFDLGFDRAGMMCKAQVEFDEKASGVLAHHWPNVKRYKDVRDVGKHNLPAVDLICGGFPCQDVSVAGKRAGLDGERSGLWFEYLRIVQELKPRWVVIENVPGLLSSNGGADFAVILQGLAKCGYCVAYRVLDSKHFGVAQRRHRVFIVASLGNGSCAEILFEPTGSERDNQASRAMGQGTPTYVIKGAAIGRQPANGPQRGEISADGTCYTLNTSEVHAVAGTLAAGGAETERFRAFGDYTPDDTASCLMSQDNKHATDLIAFNSEQTPKTARNVSLTLRAEYQAAHVNVAYPIDYALRWHTAQAFSVSENIIPTMTVSDATPLAVLPAGAFGVRRLMPVECERLQGFPDNWTAVNGQSDSARYKQCGNAVTVNVAEWLGQRVMQAALNELMGIRRVA